MKAQGKSMPKFNKIKPFQTQVLERKQFLTESIDTSASIQKSYASFDRFIYRDHVTLKSYPLDQLKPNQIFTRQNTQINNFFNHNEDNINSKAIEQLDVCKKILQKRNKTLVNGNRVYSKQKQPKTPDLSNREKFFQQPPQDEEFKFQMLKSKTTQNPLIPDTFSIPDSHRSISQQKINSKRREKGNFNHQSLIKFKRKLNNELYEVNKQILRKYLMGKNNQNLDFNFLAEDSNKLQLKLKKLKKLVYSQQLKNETMNFKYLTQQTHKKNILKNFDRNILTEKNFKCHKMRSKTQAGNSKDVFLTRRQTSLERFNKKHFTDQINKGLKSEKSKNNSCWKHKNLSPSEVQLLTKDIQQQFTRSCQIIDEQIKIKFRRDVVCSISPKKSKQIDTLI